MTDEDTAIAFVVVPGQRHDAPLLEPILKVAVDRVPAIEEVVADKGVDGRPQRQACFDLGVMPASPLSLTGVTLSSASANEAARRSETKPRANMGTSCE